MSQINFNFNVLQWSDNQKKETRPLSLDKRLKCLDLSSYDEPIVVDTMRNLQSESSSPKKGKDVLLYA